MKSPSRVFTCSNCDAQFSKWSGRCEQCGKWGTIDTEGSLPTAATKAGANLMAPARTPVSLKSIDPTQSKTERIHTTIAPVDTVLGGGFVPGSLVLLGGDPGVGKSTLSLHIASHVGRTLYISGEESIEQVRLRAVRLDSNDVLALHETNCDTILSTLVKEKPALAIIDSIQTITTSAAEGGAGSVGQIRACTTQILHVAKQHHIAVLLIGHVTKDGSVAGPKTLEHLVDAVLYLEGDDQHSMRILRAVKNRFGSTDEIGIFSMDSHGLTPTNAASSAFLSPDRVHVPGSIVTVLMDGKQPLLVEVQALTTRTTFGYPQRRASGFDLNRLQVLIAVLTARAGLPLGQYDVHVNVVGGVKATEPGADLAIAAAIVSSLRNVAWPSGTVAFGEVGLGGEVRPVRALDRRIQESIALGFSTCITPRFAGATTSTVATVRDLIGVVDSVASHNAQEAFE